MEHGETAFADTESDGERWREGSIWQLVGIYGQVVDFCAHANIVPDARL